MIRPQRWVTRHAICEGARLINTPGFYTQAQKPSSFMAAITGIWWGWAYIHLGRAPLRSLHQWSQPGEYAKATTNQLHHIRHTSWLWYSSSQSWWIRHAPVLRGRHWSSPVLVCPRFGSVHIPGQLSRRRAHHRYTMGPLVGSGTWL